MRCKKAGKRRRESGLMASDAGSPCRAEDMCAIQLAVERQTMCNFIGVCSSMIEWQNDDEIDVVDALQQALPVILSLSAQCLQCTYASSMLKEDHFLDSLPFE